MAAGMGVVLVSLIIIIPLFALFVYLLILAVRALRKYIKSGPARKEAKTVRTTLGEKLRENRVRCKLSQEFVAEAVGVSRQAVSKWENGESHADVSGRSAAGMRPKPVRTNNDKGIPQRTRRRPLR